MPDAAPSTDQPRWPAVGTAALEGDAYAEIHATIRSAPGDAEALAVALAEVYPTATDPSHLRRAEAALTLLDASGWSLSKVETDDRACTPLADHRQRAAEIIAGSALAGRIHNGTELVAAVDELARYLSTGAVTRVEVRPTPSEPT